MIPNRRVTLRLWIECPNLVPRRCIESDDPVCGRGQVENTVDDQRRGLKCHLPFAARPGGGGLLTGMVRPRSSERLYVGSRNLNKRRVARPAWVMPVNRPVGLPAEKC